MGIGRNRIHMSVAYNQESFTVTEQVLFFFDH